MKTVNFVNANLPNTTITVNTTKSVISTIPVKQPTPGNLEPVKITKHVDPTILENLKPVSPAKPVNPTIPEDPNEQKLLSGKRLNISNRVAKFFEPAKEIIPRKFKENNVD